MRCSVGAMRRATSITALLVLLLAPSAARAGDAPRLRATVSSCQAGIDPASRAAVFTASMPGNDDTARMAIRFDLQQRTVDGGVWKKVAAPSFGRWERSRPGVAGFVYTRAASAPSGRSWAQRPFFQTPPSTVRCWRSKRIAIRAVSSFPGIEAVNTAGRSGVDPGLADGSPAISVHRLPARRTGPQEDERAVEVARRIAPTEHRTALQGFAATNASAPARSRAGPARGCRSGPRRP